jgi:hypothetical protein
MSKSNASEEERQREGKVMSKVETTGTHGGGISSN